MVKAMSNFSFLQTHAERVGPLYSLGALLLHFILRIEKQVTVGDLRQFFNACVIFASTYEELLLVC
jgi:hypothetical protein